MHSTYMGNPLRDHSVGIIFAVSAVFAMGAYPSSVISTEKPRGLRWVKRMGPATRLDTHPHSYNAVA